MNMSRCKYCEVEFKSKYERSYCSDSCKTLFNRKANNPHQLRNKKCKKCSKDFRATHSAKFCSKECGEKEIICLKCFKKFNGHFNKKFCSTACKDAYKAQKHTGKFLTCATCDNMYQETFGNKRNKNKVCSVKCSNILVSSTSGKYVSIEDIEKVILDCDIQPTVIYVSNTLNISETTIVERVKDKYGNYREAVASLRGEYKLADDGRSHTSEILFCYLDEIFEERGIREKTFKGLLNPMSGMNLRIDYFSKKHNLAIEYHGKQHYEYVEFFDNGDTEQLKLRQYRDNVKEKFLKENEINFITFNYLDSLDECSIKEKISDFL